jgi:hypothetical protein
MTKLYSGTPQILWVVVGIPLLVGVVYTVVAGRSMKAQGAAESVATPPRVVAVIELDQAKLGYAVTVSQARLGGPAQILDGLRVAKGGEPTRLALMDIASSTSTRATEA